MELDKKLEAMLKKKITLEKLRVEEETLNACKEKIEQSLQKSNDLRSLETNIKTVLHALETRLRTLHSEIKELG